MEVTQHYLDMMAWIMIGVSPVVNFMLVAGIKAPYGRYQSTSWGPKLGVKKAWILQELPSFAFPFYIALTSQTTLNLVQKILIGCFLTHYANRTFIYPMLIRGGKPTPFVIMLMAWSFCVFNGFMQGSQIVHHSTYTDDYLYTWNFISGMLLFLFGMRTNIRCDSILRNLRKPGETGYKIPQGDMFNYLSGANLWGETVEWIGFSLMCWNLQALAFAIFAVCYLSGRSYSHHVWYCSKFDDYKQLNRKIFIPFVL